MIRATTSASNLFRRDLCPGSERMESGIPEEDSPDSSEGRLLHHYDANPELDRSVLKPEQRDLLKLSCILDEQIFRRAEEQFPNDAVHVDAREVTMNYLALRGHADLTRYYPSVKLGVIIDKKFGRRAQVPAALNKQLRAYAVMLAEMVTVENVIVAITQPRLRFEERILMAIYQAEDIVASRREIDFILKESRRKDAPLVAGEEQCRYCKAKIKCPAYAATFKELELRPSLELATPEQISKLLHAIKFADFIKDQVREIGRKMVADGRIDDWKLGPASSMRKIMDTAKAIGLLQLKGDLTRDEILECSNPSLTKLRDKLREKTGCTWKEANEQIDGVLAEVIEIEEKKPALIPAK